LAFVIVAQGLHPFGFVASLAFGLLFAYLTISFLGRFFVVSQFDGSFFSKVSNTGQTPFACH
jgi:hypothetical protein